MTRHTDFTSAAKGKSIVTIHDPALGHALKEVDGVTMAVAETPDQVVRILDYPSTAGSRAKVAEGPVSAERFHLARMNDQGVGPWRPSQSARN